jgi:myo-inositol-1(or 4)-monophosphatase
MLTLRPTWEWDVAAGALIASEAGATVTDRHGRSLAFNNPDPRLDGVLAAGPMLHAAVHERMA